MNLLQKFTSRLKQEGGIVEDEQDQQDVQNEDTDDNDDKSESTSKSDVKVLFELLSHSVVQAHYWHLITKSYAEHKALNAYYDEIVALMDNFCESVLPFHGDFEAPELDEFNGYDDEIVLVYFKKLYESIEDVRKNEKLLQGQSILDDILALIGKTQYLLERK